jgi:hypothetical protein
MYAIAGTTGMVGGALTKADASVSTQGDWK